MRPPVSSLCTIVVLVAIGQAHAADVGRVLLAAGDTVAVRDKQVIKLVFGSTIQDRDVLRTGPASNLQLRFTDESILSMRANSEVRIDEFRFSGKEDGSERAFFSLLKGGLRKITGIIGRINQTNYQMSTAVATIGIRGTHYLATVCQQDCRNPDGTLAKDGLYGLPLAASSTSKNSITNATGEHIFGIGQPYYVQDFKTAPQLLLEPPGLLAVAVRGKSTKPSAGTGTEQAAAEGMQHDPRGTTPPPPSVVLPRVLTGSSSTTDGFLDPVNAATTGASTATAALPAPGVVSGIIPGVGNGAVTHRFVSGASSTVSSIDPNATLSTNSQGQLTAFNATNISGLLGTGTAAADGSNLAAGNLHWGRWFGSGATINTGSGNLPVSELHYIVGDIATLPGANTFIYTSVGGTAPSTAAGLTGSFDSRGTVTVNFVARNLTLNAWQLNFTGATYSQQGAPAVSFTSSAIPLTNFQWACAGSSCGSTSNIPGQFSGSFVGAGATGIGIVYRAQDTVVSAGVGNGDITGAQGFKKP